MFENLKKEYEKHNLINLTHETQTKILENDFKILEQIDKKQDKILNLIENYISNSSFWNSSFKKFSAYELFTGSKLLFTVRPAFFSRSRCVNVTVFHIASPF
jgi:hypothetical protein